MYKKKIRFFVSDSKLTNSTPLFWFKHKESQMTALVVIHCVIGVSKNKKIEKNLKSWFKVR